MNNKKNYQNQKRLAKTAIGNSLKGAYFDDKKGRYVAIDTDGTQTKLKKHARRVVRRKLNNNLFSLSKSKIHNKLNNLWSELD